MGKRHKFGAQFVAALFSGCGVIAYRLGDIDKLGKHRIGGVDVRGLGGQVIKVLDPQWTDVYLPARLF